MRIGFTYDMREEYAARGCSELQTAEMDSEETILTIADAIASHGHAVDRIGNLDALVSRLAAGERWDLVFNIAEGMGAISREAQIPALLEAYGIPFVFSSAWTMMVTLDKALTKALLFRDDIATAPWRTVETEQDLMAVDLPFPLFVKPIGEGSSVGIERYSLVADPAALQSSCRRLWAAHNQPLLIEPYLDGAEFTVGILGQGADAVSIGVLERKLDSMADGFARSFAIKKFDHENQDFYALRGDALGQQVAELALNAWRTVKGRDAGRIDIRCDRDGTPFVLEINALPGLKPGYSDLCILAELAGMDYPSLIGHILAPHVPNSNNAAYAEETGRHARIVGRHHS